MNKKIIPIIVQLKQNNNFIAQGISQNDAGVVFDIKIMDGLESFNFAGYDIVTLKIQKPDETFTYDSDTGAYVDIVDAVNGRLKINIPTSCTAQNGMHFCTVGFAHSEDTLFETMTFNYYVSQNPTPDEDDIRGTNEYPILGNLITQCSGFVSAENMRVSSEEDRAAAEAARRAEYLQIKQSFEETLAQVTSTLAECQSMLGEVLQALADGGEVDVSLLTALATKSYVSNALSLLNYGADSTKHLCIYNVDDDEDISLKEYLQGELGYSFDKNKLYIGTGVNDNLVWVNRPCFEASSEAPDDTAFLWIDTSGTVPVIKYHDGNAWVNCNVAVYA